MSLGVHMALSDEDEQLILDPELEPEDLVDLITEDLEERYLDDDNWSSQSDKAWDAIHRCLTDGRLLYESGPFPLAFAVLGGEVLDAGEDYTACLATREEVKEVSAALKGVTRAWMRERYDTLGDTDYSGPLGDADFEYTWENLVGLRAFFERAAAADRSVLFTTDA